MKIRKAVITAAGPNQRSLPLQTLVDRDGVEKPVLRILVEEALRAGVEEIAIVVCPGDETPYSRVAGDYASRLHFVPQPEPLGYGHAIQCARGFVGRDPFLHLVGDHLYISRTEKSCAAQLVEVAEAQSCAVSAVQATRENLLPRYGAAGGQRVAGSQDLYRIDTVIEKPTPTEAEQRLVVPGLRAGHYLCFFGMHVLTPAVMEFLGPRDQLVGGAGGLSATRAVPGPGARESPLRYRREVWIAERPTGAGADRMRSRGGSFATAGIAGTAGNAGGREVAGMSQLTDIVTAADPALRNRSLDAFCRAASLTELQQESAALDAFRRASDNLYERVRALFFLYAIHRFHAPGKAGMAAVGRIPFAGYEHLLQRRFEEAIEGFLSAQGSSGPNAAISSALAAAYQGLAFQTLAGQVRRSVRTVRGNQWMFRTGHPADYPLRLRPELLRPTDGLFPILRETTPVRMDLTHSGWSDIFFLGMDFPEGARVLNVSIDLAVRGAGAPKPPVEAWLRVIDEPVLRLTSVDLRASAEIGTLAEVFDFARDYLGLLKAAVIASGIVPPGMEGAGQPLADVLAVLTGRAGHGIEIVSRVNDIPKGSRLAVSTNLLASLIAVCMRATGQAHALTGPLAEGDRRLAAARAILGEWLGGSGGGWQDSGGLWPAMKLIEGVAAGPGDPEDGISRGCLLPRHRILGEEEFSAETRRNLQASLVLVHGGMAQDVGPILEMVTEKYLLRSEAEWQGRQQAMRTLDEILGHVRAGNVAAIGAATERNFAGPIQAIIPWASNLYTETLIRRAREEMGSDFWGFWMLGGMSGGGMGFLFHPAVKARAAERLEIIMRETKRQMERAVPFAMEPVVYDFRINEGGTHARLLAGDAALMPPDYYTLAVPTLLRTETRMLSPARRAELNRFASACRTAPELSGMVQNLFDHMLPRSGADGDGSQNLAALLDRYGFDRAQHEQIQSDLRSGRIGLAQNRLPATSTVEDPAAGEIVDSTAGLPPLSRTRHAGFGRRAGGGRHPGGRRRKPLDQRRGRGESAQSFLQNCRQASQFH